MKMQKDSLAENYGVNVMRMQRPRKQGRDMSYYVAFLGGNGTGEPVEEIARAFTLTRLDFLLRRWQEGGAA